MLCIPLVITDKQTPVIAGRESSIIFAIPAAPKGLSNVPAKAGPGAIFFLTSRARQQAVYFTVHPNRQWYQPLVLTAIFK